MGKPGVGPVRCAPSDAPAARSEADGADPAPSPGVKAPAAIGIRCLACGSDDLDAADAPRGDEPVRCRNCDAWYSYLQLEIAAVEAVRRDRARRGGR